MKMFRRMLVRRRVAAPRMPALHTHTQMDPRTTDLQTILTTLRRRLHLMYMVQMGTFHSSTSPRLILSSIRYATHKTAPNSPDSCTVAFWLSSRPDPERVKRVEGEVEGSAVVLAFVFAVVFVFVLPLPLPFLLSSPKGICRRCPRCRRCHCCRCCRPCAVADAVATALALAFLPEAKQNGCPILRSLTAKGGMHSHRPATFLPLLFLLSSPKGICRCLKPSPHPTNPPAPP
jgi:hypothetical protein